MTEHEYEVRTCACGIPLQEGEDVCVICAQTENEETFSVPIEINGITWYATPSSVAKFTESED